MKFNIFGLEISFSKVKKSKVIVTTNTISADEFFDRKLAEAIKDNVDTLGKLYEVEPKKHATGYSSKKWLQEDVDKLVDMYNRNLTTVGIARMLSRTTAAVTSKLWKLKKDGIIV